MPRQLLEANVPIPIEQIEAQAMQLSPQERADLADRLWWSVESQKEPFALSPEWEAEIARRVAELEAGNTQFIPAQEAMARLTDHIQSRLTKK
jgi:putative addiction module component (TIGR02574 family)